MGLSLIKISNFKSLKNIKLNLDCLTDYQIYCTLGKNGTGKTTIIEAIRYLYNLAYKKFAIEDVIDKSNIYVQKMSIEIIFDLSNLLINNSSKYFNEFKKEYQNYIINNKLSVKITQYKNGEVVWSPVNDVYFIRKILKIFPVFFVNTRFISLTDWSDLWNIISEISISEIKDSADVVEQNLKKVFEDTYGPKYSKSIQKIENIFDEEHININKQEYLARFKNAVMTQLGGNTFLTDNNSLLYYSDGMNSLKYIKLLVKLIIYLSDTAWKNFLIILDEPEIGLHPKFIEELADLFMIKRSKKVNILLTTHSTHLISSILKNGTLICFYRLYLKNGYTEIEKMRDIVNPKDTFLIDDAEAESYFSDVIVFVEGQTEIQLLKNKNLISLFPCLRKVTIYNTKSTDSVTKLIIPRYSNTTVPYVNILDMDKILIYDIEKQQFSINKKSINPLHNCEIIEKQKYLIFNDSDEKYYTYNLRSKIQELLKKTIIPQTFNHYWIDDENYNLLLEMIKLYCFKNNCFIMKTTIEGAIANENNNGILLSWLKEKLNSSTYLLLADLLNSVNCNEHKTTILRLILNGKLDNLFNMKKHGLVPTDVQKQIVTIKEAIGKKTSGWIFDFLDYYFKNHLVDDNELMKDKFKNDFPELFNLLQMMENLLE